MLKHISSPYVPLERQVVWAVNRFSASYGVHLIIVRWMNRVLASNWGKSMESADTLTKHQLYQLILTVIATIGGIATVLIGISSYNTEQEAARHDQVEARRAQDTAAKRDAELRRQEIQRRIEELNARVWEQRINTYSGVARGAATIAITCDADSKEEPERFRMCEAARREFWRAYWGDMSLIEDNIVEIAMIIFGEAVKAWEEQREKADKTLTTTDLKNLSYYLAHVYRKSLSMTWNPENAFDQQVLIPNPLRKMYKAGVSAGLDIKKWEHRVLDYDN